MAGTGGGADTRVTVALPWVTVAPRRRAARMARDLSDLSDADLVRAAATGDDRALAQLYDRFGSLAYGLALRVLRDRSLAEDAVQDAFLAAWRGAARFDPERGAVRAWLLTLVHRRAVDLVRREERQPDAVADPQPAAVAAGADDDAATRDERTRVQAALAQLPDAERSLLELAYYGGFTQSQLAERLDEPLGTIKSRMFSGLRRLRTILSEAT
jgi:RNA polymerase sigma factor (sigma-70 family)